MTAPPAMATKQKQHPSVLDGSITKTIHNNNNSTIHPLHASYSFPPRSPAPTPSPPPSPSPHSALASPKSFLPFSISLNFPFSISSSSSSSSSSPSTPPSPSPSSHKLFSSYPHSISPSSSNSLSSSSNTSSIVHNSNLRPKYHYSKRPLQQRIPQTSEHYHRHNLASLSSSASSLGSHSSSSAQSSPTSSPSPSPPSSPRLTTAFTPYSSSLSFIPATTNCNRSNNMDSSSSSSSSSPSSSSPTNSSTTSSNIASSTTATATSTTSTSSSSVHAAASSISSNTNSAATHQHHHHHHHKNVSNHHHSHHQHHQHQNSTLGLEGPYLFLFDMALSLYYPIRAFVLFVLGFVFSLVIDHLQTQHHLVEIPMAAFGSGHQWFDTASWLPPTCGASAVLIGTIYPLGDYLWWGRRAERVHHDWSSVMRCLGGFIGVNYAASKLPWTSSVQVSCTLALISLALWFLFDRTFHGFMISLTVASLGTIVAYFLVLHGWYSFTRADFFGVGSWIPCILYSSSVCFGSIGRQLDVVPEAWYNERVHLKAE